MGNETDRVEKKILLRAPRERVWRAVSDSGEFGTWFGMKLEGPFAEGKKVRGTMAPTTVDPEVGKLQKEFEGLGIELLVEKIDPPRLLSFRWHPNAIEERDYSAEKTTLVAFALEEVPGGVLLTVTESGFDGLPLERRAKAFNANSQGWAIVIKLVEKYLAHGA
jgi:uncharacterized protein YndB with AHSA1/START domain